MILDLRFKARINQKIIPLFNEVAFSSRNSFNTYIETISRPLINNIDWWSENTSSRNTYASPLFHYFCCINFILRIVKEKNFKLDLIYVDSKELQKIFNKIINEYCSNEIKVLYKPNLILKFKRFLKNNFYYEWFFLKRCFQLLLVRFFNFFSKPIFYNKPLILIDTFLTKQTLFSDRWYGNLWSLIDEDLKKNTYFVPSIINTTFINMIIIYKNIINLNRNVIIKDNFITMNDLFYAYNHKKRLKKLLLGKYFFLNIDLTNLATEDLYQNRDIPSLFESLLTYRFFYRISKLKIKIKLSIDWFEGHSLDKLWNLGMNHFFPEIKRIGYLTFRSFPFYLSTYPIALEREAEVIPDVFAVQGKKCVDTVREFLPNQEVIIIPAFKYEYIWKSDLDKFSNINNQILVSFPISLESSVTILEMLISSFQKIKNFPIKPKFILKPHPLITIKQIQNKLKTNIPSFFQFTKEKSFEKLLINSNILITEASSTCLEAFAFGKSVIIIENPYGLTYDPVPNDIPQNLFLRCNTADKLTTAISHFLSYTPTQIKNNKIIGNEIKKDYFHPITKKGINKFFNINH